LPIIRQYIQALRCTAREKKRRVREGK